MSTGSPPQGASGIWADLLTCPGGVVDAGWRQSVPADQRARHGFHYEALRHEIPKRGRPKWACQRSCLGWVTRRLGGRGTLTLLALLEPIAVAVHLEDVDVVGQTVGSMQTCGGDYAAVAVTSSSFAGRKPE